MKLNKEADISRTAQNAINSQSTERNVVRGRFRVRRGDIERGQNYSRAALGKLCENKPKGAGTYFLSNLAEYNTVQTV